MKSRKNKSAFTLVETLIVVGIVAIMTAMIVKLTTRFDNQTKEHLAATTFTMLETALDQYRQFGYRYRDYSRYTGTDEPEFYRALEFPPDCNGFSESKLENTIEKALDILVSSVSIEGTHDPNYSSTEAMCFFLSQVPESRKTLEKIDRSMLTNEDEGEAGGGGRTIKINNDADAREYPLWRVEDPWGTPLRYDYYINEDETANPSISSWADRKDTIRTFPVLTSAGSDREFGTSDDITSR